MKTIKIGPYVLGADNPPLVIAEAGINHNGDIALALDMVAAAKEAGADIVKFQTHLAAHEMLPDRQLGNDAGSHVTRSLYEIMKECELSIDEHKMLKEKAEALDLMFMSTPFSIQAVDLLEEVGVAAYKIGSGEVTNIPFLEYVAERGKPIIISTGTASWDEVGTAIAAVRKRVKDIILMQCTSNYPTAYKEVNLGVLKKMRDEYDVLVGLSDHCQGNYACFGSIAYGACIVEKHFTLSRSLPGVDQQSSIEPQQLKDLVDGVRAVYEASGDTKEVNEEAKKVRYGFSESVVTIAPIKKGERLEAHKNIWVKRPGSGIPSYELQTVVGKYAMRDMEADYLLTHEDIKD